MGKHALWQILETGVTVLRKNERGRSSELKLSRRQLIRTLVRLSRLPETHALDELRDPNTAAHSELIGLISGLATRKAPFKR